MRTQAFGDSARRSLQQMRPKIAAAGWRVESIDEAIDVLSAVTSRASYASASAAIRSKAEILLQWRYLDYWYFEGAPLSVQLALWAGLECGGLEAPPERRARIAEFVVYFPRQLAIEAAKRASETVGGWIFPGEAELFWESLHTVSSVQGDVLEIGCWVGRSAIVLAAGLEAISPSKRLHVADDWCFGGQPALYPYLSDARNIRAEFEENTSPWRQRIVVHEGLFQDLTDQIAKASEVGFSLVFHDAGHTPADFRRDLPLIEPLLNPGSYLIIHDYVSKQFGESRATIDAWIASRPAMRLERTLGTCAVIRNQA